MTSAPRSTKLLTYVAAYLKDFRVGAFSPSSSGLIARLVRQLRTVEPKLIIELGPGDGVSTKAALQVLTPHGQLFAIERNHEFAAALEQWTDERLHVTEGDARLADKQYHDLLGRADAVIASVPFSFLNSDDRVTITAAAAKLLRPGGVFVVFHQYSPLMRPVIKKAFGHVHTEFEPWNFFPAFLLSATKK